MEYITEGFINDLKSELSKLINKSLTDEIFGVLLGKTKNNIREKRYQIRKNHDYKISLKVLDDYIQSIREKFYLKFENAIDIIKKYIKYNNIPKSNHGIFKFHPNLKINYFKTIDTKAKLYWLGWLYTEG